MDRTREAEAPIPASPLDTYGLPLVLLAGLALRLWLAALNSGLTMDSPLYVRMAEALRAGQPLAAPAHQGYPLLVALASFVVPGREWPGRWVSLAASLALVALIWWAARRRWGPLPSLVAAAVVALHPLLAVYGVAIMTEASFLALAFAGVALLERGRASAGGALLGAAWWVRPEAAVVAPLAILFAPLRARARGLAVLVALAVALSHSFVLASAEGRWSLTPKTALVRAPYADARAAEWRLADSTVFADSVGVRERLERDGRAIAQAYPARLVTHAARAAEAWTLPFLVVAFAGLVSGGGGAWLAFVALPLVWPLVSAPADPRFAQLTLPAMAMLAAAAADRSRAGGRASHVAAGIVIAAGVLALWLGGPSRARALAFDDGPMAALRGAGSWLAAHSAPDAVVMDRKSYVPFFADRRHVQLPDEPLDVVLAHARESGATHLVVEEYVVRSLRPQLAPLLDAAALRGEPRVRLAFATRPAPGEGVVILEVVR
jgi:hypothetical protein